VTSGGVIETATVNVTVTAVADAAADALTITRTPARPNVMVLANDSFENSGRDDHAPSPRGRRGSVTINNNGTPANPADDYVVYTPTANSNGTDTFTYTVTSNGTTETETVTMTVTAVNDAPTIANLGGDSASWTEHPRPHISTPARARSLQTSTARTSTAAP
jgi:VCBS repeat-containing protein